MNKMKSIFFRIGLFMLPVVLLLEAVVMLLTYNITYESNMERCKQNIQNAAETTVKYSQAMNLYSSAAQVQREGEFARYCKMFDVTYIYAVEIDPEDRSATYLVIGFGEDASKEAKKTRYSGVRVAGAVTDAELEAFNKTDGEGVFLHYRNKLDDTLVYYMPVFSYYDSGSLEFIDYDSPLLIGAEISLTGIKRTFQAHFRQIAFLTVALTLVMLIIFGLILYFMVTKPLRRISRRMSSFVTDREKGIEPLAVRGSDELAQMASSFNTMTEEIDRYINDIDTLHREQHTREAELNIARSIQKGLLQPELTDSGTVRLHAYMLPARDVGGDLYDYHVLDDGRVFVTIADVSGKGISAALFMSRAITLLHQDAEKGYSPAEILDGYNKALAENNSRRLFITTFAAVWDPRTSELTYSNAGHNYPYILSDKVTPLTDGHGVAAGLFTNAVFKNAVVKLNKGDTLFLYTDGVNEAENTAGEYYSTERLEEQLSHCLGSDHDEPINVVLSDLNRFTAGAEQNDDITMLTLRIK